MLRFCEALGVHTPEPPTDSYRFELPVAVVDREGTESINFIDLWKAEHFALEAKALGESNRADLQLRKAFGQVRNYVAHVSGDAPPYLMVVDVPRTLIVWDRWSGAYGDFAAGRRIALSTLHDRPDDIALLYDSFEQPWVRDPRGKAQAVTKEIAAGLAELAAELESRGLETERVARFLMRCVFSCFAEDVDLLPENLFRRTLETARRSGDHEHLSRALTSLWKTMDEGGMFGAELLHRFNGHFFKTVEALPLEARDVTLLIDAAKHDWSRVEPSIFGTLLVRALDPDERHRLGAEYTPPKYIERLVEPTVVEPIRERWTAVQAAVLQLEERGKKKDRAEAIAQLRGFHDSMRSLSFLDPACGSGNFLYVTMAAVKRIEVEVLNEIARLSDGQGGLVLDEVHPRQFHGIEVKPWAREIAELTLWIGYHQFWRETHGGRTPPDPILEDTGTIECRDAVLAWDAIVHRPEKDRPDPTPRIESPVTGELVPDLEGKLPYYEYVGVRQAEWPKADFIVGNPPYMGNKRMREGLGDGYVDALRAAYPKLPESIDFVMYWWTRAAAVVASGDTVRAGLITTNSITQLFHQPLVAEAAASGAHVVWAAPDHPWADGSESAAVRVAMTVLSREGGRAERFEVDDAGEITRSRMAARLNADLTADADVAGAASRPLSANAGLSSRGVTLVGAGFLLEAEEAERLRTTEGAHAGIIKPYRNGRDLTARPRGVFVIDFGMMSEREALAYPVLYDVVRTRVKPGRDAMRRKSRKRNWWRFGEPNPKLRDLIRDIDRYIATPYVSRQRFFTFQHSQIVPDDKIVVIGDDRAFVLGVLSSRIHRDWADSAGTRLGVGNDSTYNNPRCFDAFPFPDASPDLLIRIATLAERLDAHRKAAIARDAGVTMAGMYNVVEKLRSGEPLTPKERVIHEIAACGVLRDLHDELDQLVAEAYGWLWPMKKEVILERLVALHDERVDDEKRGIVRWLRPDYQNPRFAPAAPVPALQLETASVAPAPVSAEARPWPATAVEQLAALGALVAQRPVTPDDVVANFTGARRDLVTRHLETLALMGEVTTDATGRYHAARKVA